jgi:hypothetical protein
MIITLWITFLLGMPWRIKVIIRWSMQWIVRFWMCYVNNSWCNFFIVFVALVACMASHYLLCLCCCWHEDYSCWSTFQFGTWCMQLLNMIWINEGLDIRPSSFSSNWIFSFEFYTLHVCYFMVLLDCGGAMYKWFYCDVILIKSINVNMQVWSWCVWLMQV